MERRGSLAERSRGEQALGEVPGGLGALPAPAPPAVLAFCFVKSPVGHALATEASCSCSSWAAYVAGSFISVMDHEVSHVSDTIIPSEKGSQNYGRTQPWTQRTHISDTVITGRSSRVDAPHPEALDVESPVLSAEQVRWLFQVVNYLKSTRHPLRQVVRFQATLHAGALGHQHAKNNCLKPSTWAAGASGPARFSGKERLFHRRCRHW
jgi:hypothetical protein